MQQLTINKAKEIRALNLVFHICQRKNVVNVSGYKKYQLTDKTKKILTELKHDILIDSYQDLNAIGQAVITWCGNENLYFSAHGADYYTKLVDPDNFSIGQFDFSSLDFGA